MFTARQHAANDAGPAVLWLGDAGAGDPALTGGKAASLSRLAARHPVPAGFVLTLPGDAILGREQRALLAGAYCELTTRTGAAEPVVAVRSSAVDEDSLDASFAGQHDTFLNMRGPEQVWWAAGRCVASFASAQAREYRAARDLPAAPARVAVLVQVLVGADVSGVVFSANPVTGNRDEIVVNASWGLGESIVGGTVTPDTVLVDRDLAGLRRTTATKRVMTIPVEGGTHEVTVPGRLARMPALDDDQARDAAALALALERETGHPVDLELAWAAGQIFLLQCRPITTLKDERNR